MLLARCFQGIPLFWTCSCMHVEVEDALRHLGAEMEEFPKEKVKVMAKARPLHPFLVDADGLANLIRTLALGVVAR